MSLTAAGADDPVLGVLPERFEALVGNHYAFEVPRRGVELASSDVQPQAYRVGDRAWAVQFHPEARREQVLAWFEEDEKAGCCRGRWPSSSASSRRRSRAGTGSAGSSASPSSTRPKPRDGGSAAEVGRVVADARGEREDDGGRPGHERRADARSNQTLTEAIEPQRPQRASA